MSTRALASAMSQAGFPVSHQRISDYERATLPSEAYIEALEGVLGLDEGTLLTLWREERRGQLTNRRTARPEEEPPNRPVRSAFRVRLVIAGVIAAAVAATAVVLGYASSDGDERTATGSTSEGGAEQARVEGPAGIECVPVGRGNPTYGPVFVEAFQAAGGESVLGCAINDIHQWGPGFIQDLRGGQRGRGAIMALRPEHVVVIDGDSWIQYEELIGPGESAPIAGYPVTVDEPCADGRLMQLAGGSSGPGGLFQRFNNRQWIWVYGPVWTRYLQQGGPTGPLGFPTARVVTSPEGLLQEFDGGAIDIDADAVTNSNPPAEISSARAPLC